MMDDRAKSEKERRERAYAHRSEVVKGGAEVIEPRKLGQMVSLRLDGEVLSALRELANQRGSTVSDLLREGAALVIARNVASATSYVTHYQVMVDSVTRGFSSNDFGTGVSGESVAVGR